METFSALLAICVGNSPVPGEFPTIHRSPVNSPHKGQWRGALTFSLICAWINGWVNNREVGDLRRYRAHYDVTVMKSLLYQIIEAEWHIYASVNQPSLVQTMPCPLAGGKPLSKKNAGILLIGHLWTNFSEIYLNRNLYIFVQENAFENVVRTIGRHFVSASMC